MEEFASTFGDVPDGKGAMALLNQSGDTKTIWDPNNAAEVAAAREQFDKLVGTNRFSAFRVSEKDPNEPGVRLREFDPEARRIIFIPPMQGG
jgi:hypothetical protein